VEIANASEAVLDGRMYIELINGASLEAGGTGLSRTGGAQRWCRARNSCQLAFKFDPHCLTQNVTG